MCGPPRSSITGEGDRGELQGCQHAGRRRRSMACVETGGRGARSHGGSRPPAEQRVVEVGRQRRGRRARHRLDGQVGERVQRQLLRRGQGGPSGRASPAGRPRSATGAGGGIVPEPVTTTAGTRPRSSPCAQPTVTPPGPRAVIRGQRTGAVPRATRPRITVSPGRAARPTPASSQTRSSRDSGRDVRPGVRSSAASTSASVHSGTRNRRGTNAARVASVIRR